MYSRMMRRTKTRIARLVILVSSTSTIALWSLSIIAVTNRYDKQFDVLLSKGQLTIRIATGDVSFYSDEFGLEHNIDYLLANRDLRVRDISIGPPIVFLNLHETPYWRQDFAKPAWLLDSYFWKSRSFGLGLPKINSSMTPVSPWQFDFSTKTGLVWKADVPLGWATVLVLLTSIFIWRRTRPYPPGHCPECNYDLTDNISGVCPECGNASTVCGDEYCLSSRNEQ